uniref:Uncharacterized protein n=1 Tax=Haptolina ericina TaxID=156174 RepID=A0A7S3ASB8_9EUKA
MDVTPSTPSGWRLIEDPSGPILFALSVTTDTLNASITDLRGWYSCAYERPQLEVILSEEDISTPLDAILQVIQECFDRKKPSASYQFAIAREGGREGGLHLTWTSTASGNQLCFECGMVHDPQERLRDGLILPLLEAVGQLLCLLPAETQWAPPQLGVPLLLPSFDHPVLSAILNAASQRRGGGGSGAGSGGAGDGGAGATLAAVADAPGCVVGSNAGSSIMRGSGEQPVLTPPHSSGWEAQPGGATGGAVGESAEQKRKREREEKREKAASKQRSVAPAARKGNLPF